MPETSQLLVFIAAGWLLNLTPGPDVLYIVSSALRHGVRAGIVAALGILSGCFVHVLAAAVGVGALLATSAAAFGVLKWVGAAYLTWVGFKLLCAPASGSIVAGANLPGSEPADLARVFRRGFLTNVLNPKVALFFLAFVPQFIAPDAEHPLAVFVALGVLFIVNSLPVCCAYAWLAGWAARRTGAMQRMLQRLDRIAGFMFIGFGFKLAMSELPAR